MIGADTDMVEIQNQKWSELRQWFFEHPDRAKEVKE